MPSFIEKLSSSGKNSTTKPVFEKLYANPKKWLANTTKKSFHSDKIRKSDSLKVRVCLDHPYENIDFQQDSPGNISSDSSLKSHITVIEVASKNQHNSLDDKLKSVIDSFDQILNEYSTPTPKSRSNIPKLQKSRTCSIIESKCILKLNASKAFSKSLENLNPRTLKAKVTPFKALAAKAIPAIKPSVQKSKHENVEYKKPQYNMNNRIKVKDVVRKINSLSSTEETKSPKIEKKLENSVTPPEMNSRSLRVKCVSSLDISCPSTKKSFTSKIPVKASLNRTFPSTPNGLNSLDCKLGSTQNLQKQKRFAESVHNLKFVGDSNPPKSLTKPNKLSKLSKSTSVQNLGKFSKLEIKPNRAPTIAKPVVQVKRSLSNDPKKQTISNAIQKFENSSSANNGDKNKTKLSGATFKKEENTFGIKKLQVEPKFVERNYVNKQVSKTVSTNAKIGIQKFEAFVETKSCANKVEIKKEKLVRVEKKLSIPKKEISDDKVRDYSSDDNSDDSGNISNEHPADLSSLTSSSRNNSLESLHSISRNNSKTLILNEKNRNINEEEIFFRSGGLTQLEAHRDERLAGMVINLQSSCRGYLARKKLTQRKLQNLAVRCIQRNVRKFMMVRDWPWWRLLVRVTPLLNVHRTEEELRNKTEELELLRSKVDKLETDRTTLKHENDKLEAKLSEMTADLAEEHSTSTLAAERLDAEASERMRIERELCEVQTKNKLLQDSSERLEIELMYAKSELNGVCEEDEEGEGDGGVYKQRYERVKKELEFTKRRLQQQHEDDLEQLVGLKKQLEKKLTDAYEEVEEQRQVVGQWKRKVQKLNGETNDLRLLVEEQNARNNLLEKKQRKFDSEAQLLQDELRQEKQTKERLAREKEVVLAEKFVIESNLADARLEIDFKEDKLQALQRELDELTYGGKTEEEVTILRKQKIDCERRLHDQEEELDELAGQVQLLEQAKLRLEMSIESQRKESKRETQQRDEELEEVRCNAQKKVKALEAQLESEHEERTILLREKHELERRLTALADADRNDRAGDEALMQRLKRDLKRTKALLRDTQSQLERQKADTPGKNLIRQLRNQIEDLECARSIALKSKQSLDAELTETQATLDEVNKLKSDVDDKLNLSNRERSDLQTQLEENEEELAEVMKKYKAAVQQMSLDQIAIQEQVSLVSELETERNHLKEQLSELTAKLECVENMGEASSNLHMKRMELKTKELESKLELEQTTRSRLEVQIARLKEALDKLQTDVSSSRTKEQGAQEQIRKLQRSLRELKEQHNESVSRETEFLQKRKDLEKKCELAETETNAAKADLKLALKRIEDLQSAIQGELDDTPSDHTDSEQESYTSDESVSTFLSSSKIGVGNMKSDRNSVQFDTRRYSNASRSSSSSGQTKDFSYT